MGDDGCTQTYRWELDQAFRKSGNKELDENTRINILKGIGIPKTAKRYQGEEEEEEEDSTDSDLDEVLDRRIDVLVDPECGYPCENDVGWFDIVQSHSPWDEARRPYDQLLMYEDLNLTDKEKEGNLSGMIMATGLNLLDAIPLTDAFALTKLQLADKGLRNIQILDAYKYIQYLDLSHNTIKDLSPLNSLTYLIVLDASHNEIEQYAPRPTPWFLSFLNLSYNKLKTVPDISSMWSLKHLNLSNNCIVKIEGIHNLDYLEYINLSNNEIEVLENISRVPLKTLDVSWNKITHSRDSEDEFGGLKNISTLQRLDVSHNCIESMRYLNNINPVNIRHLNIAYNHFDCITALDGLSGYKSLRYLRLEGNSLVHAVPEVVKNVVNMLPQLSYINGTKLTKSERLSIYASWNAQPIVNRMKTYCYELLYSNVEPPEYGVETPPHLDYKIPIVILVGATGTRKYSLAKLIADRYPEYVRRPIIHSTLHKYSEDNTEVCDEFKAMNVHHVEEAEFHRLWNQAEFVYVHNDMGDLYGLSKKELVDDGRLILIAIPLEPALTMKWQGLNTTLVHVKPQDQSDYSDLLQRMVVSKTTVKKEKHEAKEVNAMPHKPSTTTTDDMNREELEEEETEAGEFDQYPTSRKSLKRSRDSDPQHHEEFDEKRYTPSTKGLIGMEMEPSTRSLKPSKSFSVSGVESKTLLDKESMVHSEIDSNEFRMTLEVPWWCSNESLSESVGTEPEEVKSIPYINTLKTHAGEKTKLWSMYSAHHEEAKFYNEDLDSWEHLFAQVVVVDNVDRAVKKILPLLVEKYNASLKTQQVEEQDPLYDILVRPRLNEMMKILADRGTAGFEQEETRGRFEAMSSEPSKDTLSVPFYSPETSSLSVTRSTSSTEFGSKEKQFDEPQDVLGRLAPPTPPETPSFILEKMAREQAKKAGFIPHEVEHSIKYSHFT